MNTFSPSMAYGGGFIPNDTHTNSTRLPLSERALSVELPEQRHKVLRSGTKKEWDTTRWIEARMMSLNRKHAKRFEPGKHWEATDRSAQEQTPTATTATTTAAANTAQSKYEELGYANATEYATDVDQVINVLWVCGTPSIQIPQMISLASFVEEGLAAYPFQPEPTFRLLAKFDVVFASLLTGRNILTNAPLTGCVPETVQEEDDDPLDEELMFSYSKKPEPVSKASATERVRIKSIAEGTRMMVLDVQAGRRRERLSQGMVPPGLPYMSAESEATSFAETDDDNTFDITDDDNDDEDMDDDDDDDDNDDGDGQSGQRRWRLEAAKVYEMTIHLLGDDLGSGLVDIE